MKFAGSDIAIVERAFEELISPDGVTLENLNRTMTFNVACFKVSFSHDLYCYHVGGNVRIIGALLTANDEEFLSVSGNSLTECCRNMAKELQEFVAQLSNVARFLRGNVILNEFDKEI